MPNKRTITQRTYLNGNLQHETVVTRVVYQRKDGTEYIRCMGNKLPLKDGVAEIYVRGGIQIQGINDIMDRIRSVHDQHLNGIDKEK